MDDYTFVESTTSTNKVMADLLDESIKEGHIVQCNFQTQGKGQAGNYWESESGKNLMFSVLLYPKFIPPVQQFSLSKAVAVAILGVLNAMKQGFEIKWPNDIYFKNKKVAGVLIETAIMGSQLQYAIIGVGLNVNQLIFNKAPNPISLQQIMGVEIDVYIILAELKKAIFTVYQQLKNGEERRLNEAYHKHLFKRDGVWSFKDANGIFKASIQHICESGQLVLKCVDGTTRKYWMKEVQFLP